MSYWEPVLRCPNCGQHASNQPTAEPEDWQAAECHVCGESYHWTAVAALEFKTMTQEQLKKGKAVLCAIQETTK